MMSPKLNTLVASTEVKRNPKKNPQFETKIFMHCVAHNQPVHQSLHIGRRLGQWKASLNSRELAIVPYHMVSKCKTQAHTKNCSVRWVEPSCHPSTYNGSCTFRCMRVIIDGSFRRLVGRLAAPPIPVRNEKQLLFAEHRQAG